MDGSTPPRRAVPPPDLSGGLTDSTPYGTSIVEPLVLDGSLASRRQKTVNFAAKRLVDMMFVTGLDQAEAERRLTRKEAGLAGGLNLEASQLSLGTAVADPWTIEADAAARSVAVTWAPADGVAATGRAMAVPGYGGIVLGTQTRPGFAPVPIGRAGFDAARAWPLGDGGGAEAHPALEAAADEMVAAWPGLYGVMVATEDRVLLERYAHGGAADRATPSWSMTKAITATLIGRLVHQGWLGSIHDPAPAPLWRDPRGVHRLVTIDHLMRMRSGLGYPVTDGAGGSRAGFENAQVYDTAEDAFLAAQRASVLTLPGSTYRYNNTGINVLGAIIRDRIEARGLPYHRTVYGLLADRIGMASYQHSADIAGNFVASGSGFARLRDYARFGMLLLQDGVWEGERLLPEGWVGAMLRPSHTGSAYAGCMRSNAAPDFPGLPRDVAWASGASGQRVMVFRRHGLVVAVANETDHAQDLPSLDRLAAAAVELV